MTRSRRLRLAVLALVSAATLGAAPKSPPAWEMAKAPQPLYAAETLERSFRIEWAAQRQASATLVSGYVYNSTNRMAVRMRLVIEGLDGTRVVGASTTWILNVPANDRNYFEERVPNAPAYRVSVLSFDWRERDDFRRRW